MGEGMERKESYSVISTHAPLVSLVLNYNTLKAERLFSTLKYNVQISQMKQRDLEVEKYFPNLT